MAAHAKFRTRLEFSQLPDDWRISNVAVDWSGEPLLLSEEGKPSYDQIGSSADAHVAWLRTPPRARHLIYWDGPSRKTLTFENSTRVLSTFVQPIGEGWLLCDGRGGRADICDRRGRTRRTLDLGDAIKDVQTTADGKIWVSYFDEGVYGGGLGQQGIRCFGPSGHPMFEYIDFAKDNDLPLIDDCYAMNVTSEDEIWLSYYSAFPLVAIRSFRLLRVWENFGCIPRAFALLEGAVVFSECYTPRQEDSRLLRRTLSQSPKSELLAPFDEQGQPIVGRFRTAARGSRFYLWTAAALYEMALV